MAIALTFNPCQFTKNGDSSLVNPLYYYEMSGEPSWFTWSSIGIFGYDPLGETGAFVVDVVKKLVSDNSTVDTGTITINVQSCVDLYTPSCCDNVYNISWLTPEGGWANYFFIGKATKGVEQGKGLDYIDANNVLRWGEVKEVYDTIIVGTGHIPQSHVDFTKSLRYAIQAYLYDSSTGTWSIPIVVNRDSFTLYKRGDKFFEWTLEFKYAAEIIVQSQ